MQYLKIFLCHYVGNLLRYLLTMCPCAHGLKLSGLLCTFHRSIFETFWTLERFFQQWLILQDETFPMPLPKWKQSDNAVKPALNEVLDERYIETCFLPSTTKKTFRDHHWNRRFRMLKLFWNATFRPILKAKKGIWDHTFLVPLIFHKERQMRKKAA